MASCSCSSHLLISTSCTNSLIYLFLFLLLLFSLLYNLTPPSPPPPSNPPFFHHNSQTMSDTQQAMNTNAVSVPVTAQITLISIILIFVLFITILVCYLRSHGYSGTIASSPSRRLNFAQPTASTLRHALDPSILNSLPITIFRSEVYGENDCLECAVCLSDLSDGEKVRFLPKCNHGFHVECIDMWFHSNNTCPLCRSLVTETTGPESSMVGIQMQPLEAVCGDGHSASEMGEGGSSYNAGSSSYSSTSTSTSRKRKEGMLVIDIPRGLTGGFSSANAPLSSSAIPSNSPLPTSRLLEEIKSPGMGGMRSFRRMLSSVSFKGMGTSRSPTGIEEGEIADSKRQ